MFGILPTLPFQWIEFKMEQNLFPIIHCYTKANNKSKCFSLKEWRFIILEKWFGKTECSFFSPKEISDAFKVKWYPVRKYWCTELVLKGKNKDDNSFYYKPKISGKGFGWLHWPQNTITTYLIYSTLAEFELKT